MRCPACEQRIEDSASYCVFCGKVFDAKRADAEDQAKMARAAAASERVAAAAMTSSDRDTAPAARRGPRLSSGELLGQTLQIWFANIGPFTLICAIMLLPAILLLVGGPLLLLLSARPPRPEVLLGTGLVGLLLFVVLQQVAVGSLTYGVVQQLRGRSAPIGDCLAIGFKTMLPTIGTGIMVGLLELIGFLGCGVGFLYMASTYFVAVPAAVIERCGASAAIERSARMTEGNRWTVFFVILGLYLVQFGVSYGEQYLMDGVRGTFDARSGLAILVPAIGLVLELLFIALVTGVWATAASTTYYRLRTAREPTTDIHEIARVFD